jgi:hypothetical protein
MARLSPRRRAAVVFALLTIGLSAQAFTSPSSCRVNLRSNVMILFAKQRKAKQRVDKSRPQQFFDAINDAQGKPTAGTTATATKEPLKKDSDLAVPASELEDSSKNLDPAAAEREARAEEARKRMEQRPEVSTMIVDEETGMELLVQGKSVMDVVTRKAVKLSDKGPEFRLAQMFPGVPMDVRDKYRIPTDWSIVQVPELVDRLYEACLITLPDGTKGLPKHPSVSSKALDFVLSNRDLFGREMKMTLGRVTMNAMSLGKKEEAAKYQTLWKHFLLIENHLSAPFRQMIMDAEGRMGPNFGNLDMASYATGPLYERVGNYLVLKGMVAHWEKKVRDAEYCERVPQTKTNYITVLSRGDPRRYLPDPPILFTLRECTQVCLMAQQLTKAFVDNTDTLFSSDFPAEIRFLEAALAVKGGTALRKYMIDEFCPAEGITPPALREGVRRLLAQMDNMQTDPYGDLTNLLEKLVLAISVGAPDGRNPYLEYVANRDPVNGPGGFQTYTFNHERQSLVRFLDAQYEGGGSDNAPPPASGLAGAGGLGSLFGFGGSTPQPKAPTRSSKSDADETFYKVPPARAAGRPHNLGWLDILKEEVDGNEEESSTVADGQTRKPKSNFGKVPAGKVLSE